MQHVALAILLIGTAALGGCSEGVLDPKGPVAAAERLVMFNSTGIMLAIVIPTILATLGTAFWFRASNTRARYMPDFDYSGRLELLVWSIPLMTILLVGGVAWLGSYDLNPPKAIASAVKPVRVQVVSLDWKWLFIYPDQGIAAVNQLTIPVGAAEKFVQWVAATRTAGPVLDAQSYAELAKPSQAVTPFTYHAVTSGLFNAILSTAMQSRDPLCLTPPASQRAPK